jgi:murein DD-endopeptidase MepM/ murein hydrolase activator NlpD
VTAALLVLPAAAAAIGEPGGAPAPSSSPAGGTQFGVPLVLDRPVLAELRLPSTMLAGRPPKVTTEVTEHGVSTVSMRAFIIDLSSRRIVLSVNMGWVRTGRRLSIPWPSSARIPAGVYRVKISAHDHHNGNLLRTATSSDVATLTVKAPVAPVTPAPKVEPPSSESGYPTPAQTLADGAVFPVQGPHNFGGPENRFGAPREGHIHEGQDVLTAEGTPDVVPLAGTIESTAYQAAGAGYYVVEHTTFGLDFMFAHCEAHSFTVHEGETVSAGQQICTAGQTGDATAPHLHFEIWVDGPWQEGGHPIDPLPYLEAWERG